MDLNPKKTGTFATEISPWIHHRKIAVYLRGRTKPWTGLLVKYVGKHAIVARWNSSTHLIPISAIDGIRFAPDDEPCRNTAHPLYHTLNDRQPDGPKEYHQHPSEFPILAADVASALTPPEAQP